MHLVLLTHSFPPQIGGVQTYLWETMRRLAEEVQITVITPVLGDLPMAASLQKIEIANGRAPSFLSVLRHLHPDRVLVGHAHPQLFTAAILSTRGHYATLTHGNDYLAAQQRWHRPLFNWFLGRSRPLITNTRANQQRLQSLGLPPAEIVYPGTDANHFSPLPELKAAHPTLLTVSRLVSRKGIDTVLQALPPLLLQLPNLRYDIVGDGPDRERLQKLTAALGLEKSVTFLGKLSASEMLAAYRRAHIFVMPAREEQENASMEGFGIVYLEASACGLPIVAGRSGGVVEAVQDGQTGLLVEPNNPQALADTLSHLLQDPEKMAQMGDHGRRWVETEMNWDKTALKLYQALQIQ